MSGAAADLEDVSTRLRRRFTTDQLGEHFAPRAVPPMALIELGHLPVDDALHQPNTH